MNATTLSIALRCASASALATAGWWLITDLTAPDMCLAAGGAFDYARWLCDFDSRERPALLNAPISTLPSFPVFCTCALAFVIAQIIPAKSPEIMHGRLLKIAVEDRG